jgi:hypothetical protein
MDLELKREERKAAERGRTQREERPDLWEEEKSQRERKQYLKKEKKTRENKRKTCRQKKKTKDDKMKICRKRKKTKENGRNISSIHSLPFLSSCQIRHSAFMAFSFYGILSSAFILN